MPGKRRDREFGSGIAHQSGTHREPLFRLVGTQLDAHRTADAVRASDATHHDQHGDRTYRSATSRKSTRTPRPPLTAVITVRRAVAVRPLRPITRPMSAGLTDTSTVVPLRPVRVVTETSSGLSTMPRTR